MEEDEDDGEEMVCSMEQLDMTTLSSVITSGVGISGALASARSSRRHDPSSSILHSAAAHVAAPLPPAELEAIGGGAATGASLSPAALLRLIP